MCDVTVSPGPSLPPAHLSAVTPHRGERGRPMRWGSEDRVQAHWPGQPGTVPAVLPTSTAIRERPGGHTRNKTIV